MKEIKFKYRIVVFLYAYLNQIDLSLDRSRWHSIDELRKFYKTQIYPKRVVDLFLKNFALESNKIQYTYFIKNIDLMSKLRGYFLRCFKNESFLYEDEIYYCCQKLLTLNQYLESDLEIHKLEIEKLRLDLCKLTFGVIKFKLSSKDRNRSMMIEHFLQNENLNLINMEEFSRGLDL